MSNKRITDLTELTTPTTDDVFPVVDIATNTTTKVQLGNLPVPTSVTTALATKENTITPGTTAQYYRGDKSFQTLDKTAVGLGNVDNTSDANKPVSTATQTALNAKQDTLVSGTNIKTLNSTSLLGSGNIVLTANPSGVAGAIQFSNGSAFASDAANLFWDNTNKRLGIGTNAPTQALDVVGQGRFSDNILFTTDFKHIGRDLNNSSISFASINSQIRAKISTGGVFEVYNAGIGQLRFQVSAGGQTTISGGGSTSATTSLLVQNSAGTELFRVRDDQQTIMRGTVTLLGLFNNDYISIGLNRIYGMSIGQGALTFNANNISYSDTGSVAGVTSSCFNIDSTTRGFLPPRMTTTQKNAIATPASGLIVYDSTTNKLCCYNGSTWNDLF